MRGGIVNIIGTHSTKSHMYPHDSFPYFQDGTSDTHHGPFWDYFIKASHCETCKQVLLLVQLLYY